MKKKKVKKPLSRKEKEALRRLNEAWGDDKDGKYKKLYERHKK